MVSGDAIRRERMMQQLVRQGIRNQRVLAAMRAVPRERFVEEALRMDTPVSVLMREAMQDTEVRGVAIPRGSQVAFGIASANRDERVYDDLRAVARNRLVRLPAPQLLQLVLQLLDEPAHVAAAQLAVHAHRVGDAARALPQLQR